MEAVTPSWREELESWLTPFLGTLGALGDRRRGRMCPWYVVGLIGPGERKSIQPMAAREGVVGHGCKVAPKRDPGFASKRDPFSPAVRAAVRGALA